MARNSLLCADVPLRNYSLTHSFRTSATNLCVAANEPPLELRRTKFCLQYVLNLGANQQNPHIMFLMRSSNHFLNANPKQIPPLSICVSCDLKDVGFQKRNVLSSNIVSTPPWLLMQPVVNYSLHTADKADIPAEIHKYRFYELCDQYADYIAYTR